MCVLMTLVSLPALVLNVSGVSYGQGLGLLERTTIGNLAQVTSGPLVLNSSSSSYDYDSSLVYRTLDVRFPGCSSYGAKDVCAIDGDDLALFYALLDVIIALFFFIGFVWLTVFERVEESQLTANKCMFQMSFCCSHTCCCSFS